MFISMYTECIGYVYQTVNLNLSDNYYINLSSLQILFCFIHSAKTDRCVICGIEDTSAPLSILGEKGCQSINIASRERGKIGFHTTNVNCDVKIPT